MKSRREFRSWVLVGCLAGILALAACSSSRQDEVVAEVVAAEDAAEEAVAEDAAVQDAPVPRALAVEATPVPPTPTPVVLGFQVTDGDDGNDFIRGSRGENSGRGVLLPGIADFQPSPIIFRDFFAIRVEVFDTRAGNRDGDGIEFVDYSLEYLDDPEARPIFESRESFPGYCIFGGGEPDCVIHRFSENGNKWPNGVDIIDGNYRARIRIVSRFKSDSNNSDPDVTEWRWAFRIEGTNPASAQTGTIEARFAELGRNSTEAIVFGSLVYRVEAFDSRVGSSDGDGIENITLRILDSGGTQVFNNVENTKAYCAFGGNRPCQELNFENQGYRWPDGAEIREGIHRLIAEINPQIGDNVVIEKEIEIRLGGAADAAGTENDIVAEFAQIGPDSTNTYVRNALVFQVRAVDTQRGNYDGEGIENVHHEIFGPNGEKVYERTEGTVSYCAFSGGEPACQIFVFADTGYTWPGSGRAVENGAHRLVATVRSQRGATRVIETMIDLQR